MTARRLVALIALLLAALACTSTSLPPTPTLYVPPTLPPAASLWPTPLGSLPGVPTPSPVSGIELTAAPTVPAGAEFASVVYVIDGDTIDVSLNGQEFRVRYIGMNTPERDEPCYEEAANANRALVENQIVMMTRDVSETDPNGRLLRYIYVGDVFVNAQLVAAGWAEARRYEPDDAQYDYFDSLEAIAAAQGLGCWPTGVFER